MIKKYIAYYRVSTNKQEYGVDAQRSSVVNFINGEPEKEFTEVESGRNGNRPILKQAVNYCKRHNTTLIIAKLDRLSRDVAFIFTLKNEGIDFVCVDLPDLNTLTLGVFASFAQFEAERISTRTKEALAERKSKGLKKNVVNNLTPERIKAGHKAISNKARTAKEVVQVLPIIQNMRKEVNSYRKIATFLNDRHFTTRNGKEFSATQVMRIYQRFQ